MWAETRTADGKYNMYLHKGLQHFLVDDWLIVYFRKQSGPMPEEDTSTHH